MIYALAQEIFNALKIRNKNVQNLTLVAVK